MVEPKDRSLQIYQKKLPAILLHNFLGGIAWGLGVTVGAAIILALGGFLISNIDVVPFIGEFVANIAEYVQDSSSRL